MQQRYNLPEASNASHETWHHGPDVLSSQRMSFRASENSRISQAALFDAWADLLSGVLGLNANAMRCFGLDGCIEFRALSFSPDELRSKREMCCAAHRLAAPQTGT